MKNHPVIWFSLFFMMGIASTSFLSFPSYLPVVSLPLSIITLLFLIYKPLKGSAKAFLMLLILSTVFSLGNIYYSDPPDISSIKKLHKEEVEVTGVVNNISLPAGSMTELILECSEIKYKEESFSVSCRFNCMIKNDSGVILYPGYNVSFSGVYVKGKGIRNPGGFDAESHHKRNGVAGVIYVDSNSNFSILEKDEDIFAGAIYRIRNYIAGQLDLYFHENSSALLKGLLLADRRNIDENVRTDFINSGTAHVLAVSGLHVGYIILIFLFLAGRMSLYLRYIVTILGILLFMFITGAPPSVLRASVMAIVILTGYLSNRSVNIFNSIALSALIILLYDPSELFLPGFQLSYTAVLSIVVIYPFFKDLAAKINFRYNAVKNIFLFSGVSVAAQIGTLPLVIYYFSKVSVISILANIFVIPVIGLILGISVAVLAAAPFLTYAAAAMASAGDLIISVLYLIVEISGNPDFSFLWVPGLSIADVLIFYSLIIITFIYLRFASSAISSVIFILLMIILLPVLLSIDDKELMPDKIFSCYIIDVGQGDAALIKFPSGKTALIDAGETTFYFDTGQRIIEPLLVNLGIKQVDYGFISHLDSDHYSGFVYLIKNNYIKHILFNFPDTTLREMKFEKFLKSCGTNYSFFTEGILKVDGSTIYILNSVDENNKNSSNDRSRVILISYGETNFLFTGDAGFKAENKMISVYGEFLKADVLKVSHHGSASATSEDFLYITRPEISVISAGEKNKFGHPSEKVLDRLSAVNSKIFRTDEEGGILFHSDGYRINKINWKE
jgi:competence protein ComEC